MSKNVHADAKPLALGADFEVARAKEKRVFAKTKHTAEEVDNAADTTRAIVEAIKATPAKTLDGFLVKAIAFKWCHGGDLSAEELVLEVAREHGKDTTDDALAWSIVLDLLAIEDGRPRSKKAA